MRTVGIICEYNPFHLGHKKQTDTLRSMGYDCIICVMSGNYTQRGEFTVFDKYTRAEAAVACGADVVVELPFPFSSLSAEGFANAGVHILASLGAQAISFGSECGDIRSLERAACATLSSEFKNIYADLQRSGLGSAAAYFEALKRVTLDDIELFSNDILGISYIAAIKRLGANISIVPIKREGAAYNETDLCNGVLPSASAIRRAMASHDGKIEDAFHGFVPKEAIPILLKSLSSGNAPITMDSIGDNIISFFKLMTPEEILSRALLRSGGGRCIADDGCGICERICNSAKNAQSLDELLNNSYTSKYPNARIQRVLLFSLLGVSDKAASSVPEHTTLLAASQFGRKYLSDIRKTADFPIVTKPADAPSGILTNLIRFSDSLYSSAIPSNTDGDFFLKKHPFMG